MPAIPLISSGGTALPAEFDVVSVDIVREANKIPYARIMLADGDIPAGKFPALDSDSLAPGKEIEIKVRVGDEVTGLFKGLVVRLEMQLAGGRPQLCVDCKDKALKLTSPRRSAIYADGTDGDAVAAILRRASLDAGDLPLEQSQPALVQYDASDWDFIVSRAEAGGSVVLVKDGTLSIAPLSVSGSSVLSLQLGIDPIDDFELELDASNQHGDVTAIGWDPAEGAPTDPAQAKALELAQGNVDPADVAQSLGLDDEALEHLVPSSSGELKAWASARLAHTRLAMVRGRLAIGGTGDLQLMDLVELAGFGDRFDGNALVTGLRHTIDGGGWRTDIRLGLPPDLFARNEDILAIPAQGLLPAARALSIGIVADYSDDPDGEYRVKVELPGVAGGEKNLWARLASPEAGGKRGYFFRPDAGDEVVLGFLADDPRKPVILGALFSSKNKPPDKFSNLSSDNIAKGFCTKHGISLELSDKDGKTVIRLKTPKAMLRIDDDKGEISLSDGNSNSILMSKDGIEIKSGKDFKLEAKGKVTLKGASIDAN